ncbi:MULTISPECIES: Gfo/Idh/MocA family oxidoreductase [unclassified Crossiella]|uniref:Gfo/Idh/MocA family oxidoreductase n=1 Tax=unclassified Crossiella TaxID=2620835 RepID=UPI001FFEED65|nr:MULTISPECIES: Gfo/Idh/MocA family oxidoreductase [unclassified Crossiella]MCK2243407.1 Gfo/Idh/MocA family oxidoreductase [Crossiella sp. S99.2]MCK2254124.1 Gfo/Idh/MocA family oxidoreductase [Crossiella sp. S99.1]
MVSTDDLRVGVLGYGIAGAVFHAPLIAATPGLRLSAVVTANPERQSALRARHPEARVLTSAEDLFAARDEFDLVVVATPNRTHVPLTLTAIEAGLPVVVDKPFAPSAEQARLLATRAAAAGVPLTVFQNRRWDNDFLTLRKLLDHGRLGRVHRFESRFERWAPTPWDNWRELPGAEEAGGILFDLGAHLVDQALQLFGPVTSVYAEMGQVRAGVQVDDDAFVALTHQDGTRSHLWMSALAAQLGPRFRVLGDQAGYTKFGLDPQEDAMAAGGRPGSPGWGTEVQSAWGQLGVGAESVPLETEPGAYQDFYAAVVAALREDAPLPVQPAEAIAALEIIEAAKRSAETREPVVVTA